MNILIAPDSFKESLTSIEVTDYLSEGFKKAKQDFEITKLPLADGGEGTVKSLVAATDGEIKKKEVTDPLGNKVEAIYGILGDKKTGVIEMATASGLPLVPRDKRNPARTTTYGTGELIKAALDQGCTKLIIGIGGSATNDCGVGMAQALGGKFLDEEVKQIGYGGRYLKDIEKIDLSQLDSRIAETEIEVACDVDNPLYGKNGAA
ncbi:MAG: glycerate kinase, partial [Bacillota bacterium]